MKGIILAAGLGRTLYPSTLVVNKQILTVYDKPMIYYPLSTLMLADIKDVLLISTPRDLDSFKTLLGDGTKFGIKISYAVQKKPQGPVAAFALAKKFIGNDACALIFGDNIFYGQGLVDKLKQAKQNALYKKMSLFCYRAKDPSRFGVLKLDKQNKPVYIEEKPKRPKSNLCVTGLYFYPPNVAEKLDKVPLSKHGEYEITSLNNMYIISEKANVITLENTFVWQDTGTYESLLNASNYINKIQKQNGIIVASLEEIAYSKG
ncbi:MAG: NTP transferase domain-containing protein [Mycoplasmoidaceae bacterium]|nr:NTP transferase domain-containing protein [Mycoplasmoidaceae bacterium]